MNLKCRELLVGELGQILTTLSVGRFLVVMVVNHENNPNYLPSLGSSSS
jgi:hypothetical protein